MTQTLCSLNFASRVRNVELGPATKRKGGADAMAEHKYACACSCLFRTDSRRFGFVLHFPIVLLIYYTYLHIFTILVAYLRCSDIVWHTQAAREGT